MYHVAVTDAPAQPPAPTPSPCVRNCCLDENDVCLGCYRTITEICGWSQASEAEKRDILAKSDARRQERARR